MASNCASGARQDSIRRYFFQIVMLNDQMIKIREKKNAIVKMCTRHTSKTIVLYITFEIKGVWRTKCYHVCISIDSLYAYDGTTFFWNLLNLKTLPASPMDAKDTTLEGKKEARVQPSCSIYFLIELFHLIVIPADNSKGSSFHHCRTHSSAPHHQSYRKGRQ